MHFCTSAASAIYPSRTFRAWLGYGAEFPAAGGGMGFVQSPLGYMRTDGVIVANDWFDLVAGFDVKLRAAIDHDEYGVPIDPPTSVWSNVTWDGRPGGAASSQFANCNGWSDRRALGAYGDATQRNREWTVAGGGGGVSCESQLRLYCFEQ